MCKWYNKKAGGFGLALIIIVAYIGFKIAKVGVDPSFVWYTGWFIAIVVSALAADLFENIESWTFNSLRIIEKKGLSSEERVEMIKTQLEVAVDRYMTIFLQVNGFETLLEKLGANANKIYKGVITVKELIIVILYAVYDLVIRQGALTLAEPYDTLIIFAGIVALKIVDANEGVAGIITQMYKESVEEVKDYDGVLLKLANHIKELAHIYHIESGTPPIDVEVMSDLEIKGLLLKIQTREQAKT